MRNGSGRTPNRRPRSSCQGGNQLGDGSDNNGPSLFPTLTDADGRVFEAVTPGMIAYARDTTKIEALKPADAMGYAPYKRSELQSIAAGARSTYELTSGDLSQTNFSSYQAGHSALPRDGRRHPRAHLHPRPRVDLGAVHRDVDPGRRPARGHAGGREASLPALDADRSGEGGRTPTRRRSATGRRRSTAS